MRFDVRKIAPLLLLIAPAVQAQLWSGPAAVEVRVEDQKGPPVAGAQLVLQYNALNPKDGPPAVFTDARGKAIIGGLAEGSWHLEVSHEGYMTYLAEITVREKGRLVLEEAAQFNVVGATRTMRVQISRGKSVPMPRAPVVAERIPAPTPAPPPPVPAAPAPRPENPPAPAPAPAEPAAPLAPTPAPAQEQPAPAPAPEPSPAKPMTPPAPAPVQPPPAAPPAPAPEPEKPAMPEPPPARPVTPPEPAPTPAPPPAPEQPAIQPAPAPPAPPSADPVRLRTAKDRTCFECPPGESALSTEWIVPPGGGSGCGDLASQLQDGEVPGGLPAGCHVLRVALPAGQRYTGYRYEVQMGGDSLDCLAGQSCPQGTGRWPINPVLVRNANGTVILAPFEAGPASGERRAVMTVYFTTGTAKRK